MGEKVRFIVGTRKGARAALFIVSILVLSQNMAITAELGDSEKEIKTFTYQDWLVWEDRPLDPTPSQTPGASETSEFMYGSVAVGVILLESNGAIDAQTEDWSAAEEAQVASEVQEGINWWASQNPNASLTFTYEFHYAVPTSYEPINRPHTDDGLWIEEAMASLGYSTGDKMQRTDEYNNYLRDTYGTDWAFTVYVADSSVDADGKFTDNWFGYAWFGGPYMQLTYDNNGWTIANMNVVTAHEMGHIFYATDEYDATPAYSGYTYALDNDGSGCVMDMGLCVSSGTASQVGWNDTDADGIIDILDTFPDSILDPYLPNPASENVLYFTGTTQEGLLENRNPWGTSKDLTLNHITSVDYRVDGGTWLPANPDDGVWDEWQEDFNFTTSALPGGEHTIEVRANNSQGNLETSYGSYVVTTPNIPPEITTADVTTAMEDVLYSVDYEADDPEGDDLEWLLSTDADFLSIDSSSGFLNGTPDATDIGPWVVNVTVKDGNLAGMPKPPFGQDAPRFILSPGVSDVTNAKFRVYAVLDQAVACSVEYDTTADFTPGTGTTFTDPTPDLASGACLVEVTGLFFGTTYHYRLKVENTTTSDVVWWPSEASTASVTAKTGGGSGSGNPTFSLTLYEGPSSSRSMAGALGLMEVDGAEPLARRSDGSGVIQFDGNDLRDASTGFYYPMTPGEIYNFDIDSIYEAPSDEPWPWQNHTYSFTHVNSNPVIADIYLEKYEQYVFDWTEFTLTVEEYIPEIASIVVEASPDLLVVNRVSNASIWLYNDTCVGIEGLAASIVLGDDDPGSNSAGWFGPVTEQGGGLYNATYFAPSSFDPNAIINVTNTQNAVYATEKIILVDEGGLVDIQDGQLQVDGAPFYIKGLSYAPTYNGSNKYDDGAVQYDMQMIADANVNTIRHYIANKYMWGGESWSDMQESADVAFDYADIHDIKIIVGFWIDYSLDWDSPTIRNEQTVLWQDMVNRYKDAEPTLMWAIGNEALNNIAGSDKISCAQWMEQMVQWTHANDPDHLVTYSDAGVGEIGTLVTYVPSLDVFSFNYYEFESPAEFQSILDTINSTWPKPVILNEYGTDSRDNDADKENITKHSRRMALLYASVESEDRDYSPGFLGSLWFEWSDQFNFEGAWDEQDPGTWWGWTPISCFDDYADLEYFGIAYNSDYGEADSRQLKDAYWTLKNLYGGESYILLAPGTNYISIPLIQPDTTLETVLASIDGLYGKVMVYDASDPGDHWKEWTAYKPAWMVDLTNIDHTMEVVINIAGLEGTVLMPSGSNPTDSTNNIQLYTGWNHVGFPSLTDKTRDTGLNNLAVDVEIGGVYRYDTGSGEWVEMTSLDDFQVGQAYRIYANQDCVWDVPL